MRTSVVIRALNEDQHIGRLLAGIERQTQRPDEVLVVDSGSSDATIDIARHYGCRILSISPEEFSFGRSLNLGIDHALGDVILIPSAHVYPLHTSWIERMLAPLDDPEVGLTYGRQVGGPPTKYPEHRVFDTWFPGETDLDQSHPFCNNANAAVRRTIWKEFKYDESLTGLEDMDFASRTMGAGWKIAYVAEAPVAHIHEESWSQIRNRYRREAIAHRAIFHDQAMSSPETVRLVTANIWADVRSAAAEGMLLSNLSDIILFRANQFVGTYLGFRHAGPVTHELKRRFFYPSSRSELRLDIDISQSNEVIDYSAGETTGEPHG